MNSMLLALFVIGTACAEGRRTEIPEEFHGVWKVVLVMEENGDRLTSADHLSERGYPVEILILRNRMVNVMSSGNSVVATAKRLGHGDVVTLALRTGYYHDKTDSITFLTLQLNGDRLIVQPAKVKFENEILQVELEPDPLRQETIFPSMQAIRDSAK